MAIVASRPDGTGILSTGNLHIGLKVILHADGEKIPLEIISAPFRLRFIRNHEWAIYVYGYDAGYHIRVLGELGVEAYRAGDWNTNYLTRA